MPTLPLLLCSRSPRRAALLTAAGLAFEPGPSPDVDETPPAGATPAQAARALAVRKARAVLDRVEAGRTVLAADTLVALDGDLLGKPSGPAEALAMLRRLRGRSHDVWTGVALARGTELLSDVAHARVRMEPVPDATLEAYVAGGEPLDKAGAYGIQGAAAAFVRLEGGRLDTVVGLPVRLLTRLLRALAGSATGACGGREAEEADGRAPNGV